MSYYEKTGMKFKPAEPNPGTDSNAAGASLDEANDINLYDDLLAFTDMSPEEQKAATNLQVIIPPQPSPVEIPEVYEQQAFEPAPQTDNVSFFEAAKDSAVNTVKKRSVEPKKEPASESQQTNVFGKDGNTDFQLAEILRVTGQFSDFSTGQGSSSICTDCGSPAGGDDLFCIICGATLEEVNGEALEEVELAIQLSCDDCGSAIESDEIFCPSCGSATFGA